MKKAKKNNIGLLSRRVLYVVIALSAIVFGAFFVVPRGGASEMMLTGVLIVFLMMVLVGAMAVAAWSVVARLRKRNRQTSEVATIPAGRISLGVVVAVGLIMAAGYLLSPGGSIVVNGGEYDNRLWIKTAGMFIIAAGSLMSVAVMFIVANYLVNRRKRHEVPVLNMVATADISFMLLIFFLVTTSMDTDRGLQRKLPPMDNNEKRQEQLVKAGSTLTFSLTDDHRLLADGEAIDANDVSSVASDFISSRGKDHLIVLDVSPQADYGLYFIVQNGLKNAYGSVRDSLSMTMFKRPLRQLDEYDAAEIIDRYPHRVTEK